MWQAESYRFVVSNKSIRNTWNCLSATRDFKPRARMPALAKQKKGLARRVPLLRGAGGCFHPLIHSSAQNLPWSIFARFCLSTL